MYVVHWKRSAIDRMTEIWLESPDRSAIADAVSEIDRVLASRPQDAGESRSDSIRIFFVPPLGVFFEVDEAAHAVDVLRVWSF
jgi:hypothetical protein